MPFFRKVTHFQSQKSKSDTTLSPPPLKSIPDSRLLRTQLIRDYCEKHLFISFAQDSLKFEFETSANILKSSILIIRDFYELLKSANSRLLRIAEIRDYYMLPTEPCLRPSSPYKHTDNSIIYQNTRVQDRKFELQRA